MNKQNKKNNQSPKICVLKLRRALTTAARPSDAARGGLSKSLIENESEGCKLCADDRSRFAGQNTRHKQKTDDTLKTGESDYDSSLAHRVTGHHASSRHVRNSVERLNH